MSTITVFRAAGVAALAVGLSACTTGATTPGGAAGSAARVSASPSFLTPSSTPEPITPVAVPQRKFPGLAPAQFSTSASGVCGPVPGNVVVVTINPDVPMPRCVIVSASQRLEVINRTDAFGQPGRVTTIQWANFPPFTLGPGQSASFPGSFGSYLAPGGHSLAASFYAGSGADIIYEPTPA